MLGMLGLSKSAYLRSRQQTIQCLSHNVLNLAQKVDIFSFFHGLSKDVVFAIDFVGLAATSSAERTTVQMSKVC